MDRETVTEAAPARNLVEIRQMIAQKLIDDGVWDGRIMPNL